MKSLFKLFLLFVFITIIFILIYEMTGQDFEILFSQEKCIKYFSGIKPFAWIVGILLLISDILLPVPATGIMAALGAVYGVYAGAIISTVGSVGAGLTGYYTARVLGKKASRWIISEEEVEKFQYFFDRWGAYAIIMSRAVPVMPEAVTILAGLSGMKFSRFIFALVAGSLPVSFFFSWIGAYSDTSPGIGILFAVLLPALIWPFFIKIVKI
ncbi:MAG: VTT domain-containing protein [Desulfobacterium sp.]|nr:VTT domain-containing protein [Desulfobacterium sp.]